MKATSAPSMIPSIADRVADEANMTAIDRLIPTTKYPYLVAWGKWLGFTPETVHRSVAEAESDAAPLDSIQKIEGKWHTLYDISNAANRRQVERLAERTTSHDRGR